ncbi:hypothetical protein GDO78_005471 [Eleutherodactylus coqui]|uniref:Uncharacterized protein n=1 Tax=Eleutherodactylus coqui TaxID=57060 RepID=A0A8J6FMA6_ELECQ|nr:hypothetical protein GDO78_005471 [Eleutherodactylus coqui]
MWKPRLRDLQYLEMLQFLSAEEYSYIYSFKVRIEHRFKLKSSIFSLTPFILMFSAPFLSFPLTTNVFAKTSYFAVKYPNA